MKVDRTKDRMAKSETRNDGAILAHDVELARKSKRNGLVQVDMSELAQFLANENRKKHEVN